MHKTNKNKRKLNNQTARQEVNTIKAVYFTANYTAGLLLKLAYTTRNLRYVQFIMRNRPHDSFVLCP